jgi:hypothetical protein
VVVIVVVIVCINGSCRSGCSRDSDVVDIFSCSVVVMCISNL